MAVEPLPEADEPEADEPEESQEGQVDLDLDAWRAAQPEATQQPRTIRIGGKVYRLRPRMPIEFTGLLYQGRTDEAMQIILVDPGDWARMRLAIPDDGDLAQIAKLYGVELGESPGSPPSVPNAGAPSKRTSGRSTGSASRRRASGRKR